MPLSRHSMGTYQETSSHATCLETLGHSRLSSLCYCGLILPKQWNYFARANFHFIEKKRGGGTGAGGESIVEDSQQQQQQKLAREEKATTTTYYLAFVYRQGSKRCFVLEGLDCQWEAKLLKSQVNACFAVITILFEEN